jgi:hypothetical protein
MPNRRIAFLFSLCLLVFVSCNEGENKSRSDLVYFDYLVWGDDESGVITAKLQFRSGHENGTALRFYPPSQVEFDGIVLKPDSAKFNGVFYEMAWPAAAFSGVHRIIFTDAERRTYSTEFEFPLITLKTQLPTRITRDTLNLNLEGTNGSDRIRIVLTDTSFYGRGIEKIDSAGGQIVITPLEWKALKSGPINLEIYSENEKPLKETTAAGGRFWLFYALKRNFILADSTNP